MSIGNDIIGAHHDAMVAEGILNQLIELIAMEDPPEPLPSPTVVPTTSPLKTAIKKGPPTKQ